jgi:WD40 repeat protein
MRSCLIFTSLVAAGFPLLAQDKPPTPGNEPIKVVALERKEPMTYENDVEPIFLKKCAFCHSGNVKEARFDMGTYEGLMKGGKRGKAIIPGKGSDSLLYQCAGKTRKPMMPPKAETPLIPEELATIKLWIDQGAKAPSGMRVKPKVVVGLPPATVHPVRAIAVSPDKKIVVASRGNQLHVYDADKGDYLKALVDPNLTTPDKKPVKAAHLSLVESLAFSADGKLLASGSFQEVILWDVATGAIKQKLTGFSDRVVALAFSPDGKMLATGGGAPTEDGEVKIFDPASGNLIKELKNAHSDTVFGVCFAGDSKRLATCGADKFVKTWELPAGTLLKSFEGHTHHVLDVGWKSDGKLLASAGADNVIKVWDFEKGEQVRTLQAAGKQVTRLLFIGTTTQVLTCSGDGQVRTWDVQSGSNTGNFSGNTDFVYAVGASPDGTVIAAGGEEGVVRLYKNRAGTPFKSLLPPDAAPKPEPPKK